MTKTFMQPPNTSRNHSKSLRQRKKRRQNTAVSKVVAASRRARVKKASLAISTKVHDSEDGTAQGSGEYGIVSTTSHVAAQLQLDNTSSNYEEDSKRQNAFDRAEKIFVDDNLLTDFATSENIEAGKSEVDYKNERSFVPAADEVTYRVAQ